MILRIIRSILGTLILAYDRVFTPRGIQRDAATQASINSQTEKLALYQYKACPFCVKVRRDMQRNSLPIKTFDAKRSQTSREELLAGGGLLKVPCLRIEDEQGEVSWMYDSGKILDYLHGRFASA
jgi:glutaredoxin